jgi:hypothetical protein
VQQAHATSNLGIWLNLKLVYLEDLENPKNGLSETSLYYQTLAVTFAQKIEKILDTTNYWYLW